MFTFAKCVQATIGISNVAKSGFGYSFLSNKAIVLEFGQLKYLISLLISENSRIVLTSSEVKEKQTAFNTPYFSSVDDIYKGISSAPKLLDMVIKFFDLQFEFGFTTIITHVAEARMIAKVRGGISCGAINEGVISGEDFVSFLSLHQLAIERSPSLHDWSHSWTGKIYPIFLHIKNWFIRDHYIVGFSYSNSNLHQKEWKPII